MATTAQQQLKDAESKHQQVSGRNALGAHPTAIAEAERMIDLAVAKSNLELAAAVQGLTEALGKSQADLGKAVDALTAKVAKLAER
ncbi:hypothetical protein [Streptomyces sp. NRRL S-340]|uniref:hypothetical protein n=1 Tax=Streptomyces sp. NRRL S-340 TaxID=1463901 RepID=UPI00055A4B78|nr:hypothetical protein [Streptomyces sp. NRRL S-340]